MKANLDVILSTFLSKLHHPHITLWQVRSKYI